MIDKKQYIEYLIPKGQTLNDILNNIDKTNFKYNHLNSSQIFSMLTI